MPDRPHSLSILPRRSVRVSARTLATVTLDHEREAILLDLSQSGLGLQATRALAAGIELHVSFFLPDGFTPVDGVAKVIWSDAAGRIGLQFLDERTQAAVAAWVERLARRKKPIVRVETRPVVH